MIHPRQPYQSTGVEDAFNAFPPKERAALLHLRTLIFETAEETEGVGPLDETLKWGQPAYLTSRSRSGSTIRLGIAKSGEYAIYVHCQTTIMSDFRAVFEDQFRFDGNRAVLFSIEENVPEVPLKALIRDALTYHQRRKA